MPTRRHSVLFAGGYTAGHVTVGLAVAEQLRDRGAGVEWVGDGDLERCLAREAGLRFHRIPSSPLVGRGAVGRGLALARLAGSSLAAGRLVRRLGIDVVVGTGGYVSAPAVLGARSVGRPALLVEPNGTVGLANRLLSWVADEAVVSVERAGRPLRCPWTVTGVPVRSDFEASCAPRGSQLRRLLVLGGSLGAPALQDALIRSIPRLAEMPLEVIHQTGPGLFEEAISAHAAGARRVGEHRFRLGRLTVDVTPFLTDLAAALAAAHLVVSSAGAATVAEICATGRPSLLVPLEVACRHQETNAEPVVAAGAGETIAEGELERLAPRVVALLDDPVTLERMSDRARSLARSGAARRAADRVLAWCDHRAGVPRALGAGARAPGSPRVRGAIRS